MGSRMKVLIILLFIGITGSIFLAKKWNEKGPEKVNFLEERGEFSDSEDEEAFHEEVSEKFPKEQTLLEKKTEPKTEIETDKASIFVHVCGAVKNEAVYELKEGARVVDAIKAAGGFSAKAAKYGINQAEILSDGIQVYIPFQDEIAGKNVDGQAFSKSDSKININSADKESLMTLPGVGESRALSIIQFRQENGKFKDIKDIMKINGIKENLFHKIKDKITV